MQKHHLLSAVVAAIVVGAAPAAAQSDSTKAKADSAKPVQQQSAGDVAITSDAEAALAAVTNASAALAKIQAATSVTAEQVRLVAVPAAAPDDSANALAAAIEKNATDLAALRIAIDANTGLKAALDAKGIASADVIGADVAADGKVTVFHQKKQ